MSEIPSKPRLKLQAELLKYDPCLAMGTKNYT